MAKEKISVDEKFQNQDLNLFDVLSALDKKDYKYFDTLSEEQQKKFVPFMMTHWMSEIKTSNQDLKKYYLESTNSHANIHLFNENVMHHPKLQWLMLCAISPGLGKQFHQYIPHLSSDVAKLKKSVKIKDIQEYFSKVYKADEKLINEISTEFVKQHNKKVYLANKYPHIKHEDIELLSTLVTDQEIEQYEKDSGN